MIEDFVGTQVRGLAAISLVLRPHTLTWGWGLNTKLGWHQLFVPLVAWLLSASYPGHTPGGGGGGLDTRLGWYQLFVPLVAWLLSALFQGDEARLLPAPCSLAAISCVTYLLYVFFPPSVGDLQGMATSAKVNPIPFVVQLIQTIHMYTFACYPLIWLIFIISRKWCIDSGPQACQVEQ